MILTTHHDTKDGDLIGEVVYNGGGYSLIAILQVYVKAKNAGP